MRYFLSGRQPPATAVLLVESGSRNIVEGVIGGLRRSWTGNAPVGLVSCFASLPEGFDRDNTTVYRVSDYRGSAARGALYRELTRQQYSHLGLICSAEPLMTKWKWVLALRVPAKVFVINENGDYFWLDRQHLNHIVRFVLFRSGLAGAGAVRTIARVVSFPFTLLYLLLYATAVHTRRALRRG
jgi:hypothetical protein